MSKINKIASILKNSPAARSNDKLLFVLYLNRYCTDKIEYMSSGPFISLDSLVEVEAESTIRRFRQIIQARGDYLPSPEVINKRQEHQLKMKKKLGYRVVAKGQSIFKAFKNIFK